MCFESDIDSVADTLTSVRLVTKKRSFERLDFIQSDV